MPPWIRIIQILLIFARTSSIMPWKARAISNFARSSCSLGFRPSFKYTYFVFPVMGSFQLANHPSHGSWIIRAHSCPSGPGGSCPAEQLIVTCSGNIFCFTMPDFGCDPRPRKRPGPSILNGCIRSWFPSTDAKAYFSNSFFSCALISAFWTLLISLICFLCFFFSAWKWSSIASKSHSSNFRIGFFPSRCLSNIFSKSQKNSP